MAGPKGKKYNVKTPEVKVLDRTATQKKYFYVDGLLYRQIRADRAADLMRAWDYENGRVVDFVLSDVKRHMQQAFDTREVCLLINRTKKSIFEHLAAGAINPPKKIGTTKNSNKRTEFGAFKWSEDDVLALHAHYLTVGTGRPRHDGVIYSGPRLPTRLELVALIKQNKMFYVQSPDGSFVPIFDQPDWT